MLTNFLIGLSLLFGYPTTTVSTQTYAVIVGISDYQALSYAKGDLRFADRDAQQVVAFLTSKVGGSVPVSHIRLLTNRQATQAAIQQALQLFQKASAGDRVILYFSGHGLPDSFVPYDAQPGNQRKLVTYQAIKAAFHNSRAITKLCIADACLSGGMAQQKANRSTIANSVRDGSNVAMMMASRSTQSAIKDLPSLPGYLG